LYIGDMDGESIAEDGWPAGMLDVAAAAWGEEEADAGPLAVLPQAARLKMAAMKMKETGTRRMNRSLPWVTAYQDIPACGCVHGG
jgi:hypothetical protein